MKISNIERLNDNNNYIITITKSYNKKATNKQKNLAAAKTKANKNKQHEKTNPWKVPWNWIAFTQNSFVISPGLFYHLIRRDTGQLANEAFTSNPIVSSKQ